MCNVMCIESPILKLAVLLLAILASIWSPPSGTADRRTVPWVMTSSPGLQLKSGRRERCCRQRPYHAENTSSRPITEVKQHRARLVLGWVTAWEHRVSLSFSLFLCIFTLSCDGHSQLGAILVFLMFTSYTTRSDVRIFFISITNKQQLWPRQSLIHLCSHAPIQLGLVTPRAEALLTFWFAVVTGKYFFFGLSVLSI